MTHKRLDIKISYQCNNHCFFCVQGDKRLLAPEKTTQEVIDIMERHKEGCDELVFTGGESTIHKDILPLIRRGCEMGYKVHLQTNGRMFAYPRFCDEVIEAGARNFTIAVHGIDARTHDGLTNCPGSYRQSMSGIGYLSSRRTNVFTNTVITRQNYRSLPAMVDMFIDSGVVGLNLTYPHLLGSAWKYRDQIIARKSVIAPYVRRALALSRKKRREATTEAIPPCFLGRWANCSLEYKLNINTVVYDTQVTHDFLQWRAQEGKMKGPLCHLCAYNDTCEGPWREYPQLFGWEEFKPVSRKAP